MNNNQINEITDNFMWLDLNAYDDNEYNETDEKLHKNIDNKIYDDEYDNDECDDNEIIDITNMNNITNTEKIIFDISNQYVDNEMNF
jgi:hypothetical protein